MFFVLLGAVKITYGLRGTPCDFAGFQDVHFSLIDVSSLNLLLGFRHSSRCRTRATDSDLYIVDGFSAPVNL